MTTRVEGKGATLVLEVDAASPEEQATADLERRLELAGDEARILGVFSERPSPPQARALESRGGRIAVQDPGSPLGALLEGMDPPIDTDLVGVLPPGARATAAPWHLLEGAGAGAPILGAWRAPVEATAVTATAGEEPVRAFVTSRVLLDSAAEVELSGTPGAGGALDLPRFAGALHSARSAVRWRAEPLEAEPPTIEAPVAARPLIRSGSRVLALVPHRDCESCLGQALESLLGQTRPPDAIVVIDDASTRPPFDVVARFPTVTLLRADQPVGPYRLVQTVIDRTDFDAYLFQDADDWSTCDRLEVLLAEAERTGAELVGTQEMRVLSLEDGRFLPVAYPLDVNRAFEIEPGHPLLHPTSLISKHLLSALGGFASSLRFGGDTELLLRAAFAARVLNVPHFGYFRRKRADSLTTSPDTGLDSPARRALLARVKARALANLERRRRGEPLVLTPFETAPPIPLSHLHGPPLGDGGSPPRTASAPRRLATVDSNPSRR